MWFGKLVCRKGGQRAIDELQRTISEIEAKYKAELGRQRKKFETDIREYEIQVETLNRANAELGKNGKAATTRIRVRTLTYNNQVCYIRFNACWSFNRIYQVALLYHFSLPHSPSQIAAQSVQPVLHGRCHILSIWTSISANTNGLRDAAPRKIDHIMLDAKSNHQAASAVSDI